MRDQCPILQTGPGVASLQGHGWVGIGTEFSNSRSSALGALPAVQALGLDLMLPPTPSLTNCGCAFP